MREALFISVDGYPVPVSAEEAGAMTVQQAAAQFAIAEATLTRMHATAFPDSSADPAASLQPLSDESKFDMLYRELYSHMDRRHFDYCAQVAAQIGLSLWSEHCYPSVEVDEVARTQTPRLIVGIGGLRVIAHRTGDYGGCDAGIIDRDDNGWPLSATVTVYRMMGDRRTPFTSTVYMNERYPGEGVDKLWDKMPATNIERCAESAALRRAFANETNGLYTFEELAATKAMRRSAQRARRADRREEWRQIQGDPRSRIDLEQRLAEMGLVDRTKRAGVMAMLDQEFGHLGDDPGRWGAAVRAVRSNPQEYGLA